MSLLNVVRAGVAIANTVTKDLQVTVTYERALGDDGYGGTTYAPATTLSAIVDYTAKQVRTQAGITTVSRATIDLLDVVELMAKTAGEGVGNNDRFTFPDGDTGPILDIGGFVDAGTGKPVATQVIIG